MSADEGLYKADEQVLSNTAVKNRGQSGAARCPGDRHRREFWADEGMIQETPYLSLGDQVAAPVDTTLAAGVRHLPVVDDAGDARHCLDEQLRPQDDVELTSLYDKTRSKSA